jgi:Putative zinc-finger
MNCDCTEKISSLIDGELPMAEARDLERHMLNCVECQKAHADFLNLRSQISEFPVSISPVAKREALARILGKEKVGTGSRGFGWRWIFSPAVAALASLLIVGAVIALLLYPRSKPGPVVDDQIASGPRKKSTPKPVPSRSEEGIQQNNRGQKNSSPKGTQRPPSNDKSRVPSKKRTPIMIEPQQDNIAENTESSTPRVRSADAETMTAIHFQKSELLLRSFRNVRLKKQGMSAELAYEKRLAQQLVYQNMILRREADSAGDAQVASLLESLEPILLDIANLPDSPKNDDVRVIKDRVERKNIVALLQVNSTALARALD